MSSSLDHISNPVEQEIKPSLVELLEVYVDQIMEPHFWDKMFENQEFATLILKYYPKYGDAVFSQLVNIIVRESEITIKQFLKEFSNFVTTYY